MTNELKYDLIQDVSETNSIYKIYICWMRGVKELKKGDKLIIYRTNDYKGSAAYRSVCTSVCTVFGKYADSSDVSSEYDNNKNNK